MHVSVTFSIYIHQIFHTRDFVFITPTDAIGKTNNFFWHKVPSLSLKGKKQNHNKTNDNSRKEETGNQANKKNQPKEPIPNSLNQWNIVSSLEQMYCNQKAFFSVTAFYNGQRLKLGKVLHSQGNVDVT